MASAEPPGWLVTVGQKSGIGNHPPLFLWPDTVVGENCFHYWVLDLLTQTASFQGKNRSRSPSIGIPECLSHVPPPPGGTPWSVAAVAIALALPRTVRPP